MISDEALLNKWAQLLAETGNFQPATLKLARWVGQKNIEYIQQLEGEAEERNNIVTIQKAEIARLKAQLATTWQPMNDHERTKPSLENENTAWMAYKTLSVCDDEYRVTIDLPDDVRLCRKQTSE